MQVLAVQVLVDVSVWADYFQDVATPGTNPLHTLIGRSPLLVADVVLTRDQGFTPLHSTPANEVPADQIGEAGTG